MYLVRGRKERQSSTLERYCVRLGNVVERNRAELALLAAKQEADRAAVMARSAMVEAETASRAKTEFLANMSHELRTPLNAIIGFSDMMVNGLIAPNQAEKQMEYARDILESGHHLLDLINDILDLAKVEAGKLDLDEQEVDVHRITASCLTLIKERAHERGLEVHLSIPERAPPIRVDERKFKQILINLLSNAVKFTPSGGKVSLRAGFASDGGFMVKVSDTGIGIAKEDIAKALAPFTQVDSDLGRSYEGTGLGLPLSKALVELHGGRLYIESRQEMGTTVTIYLPAQRVARTAARISATGAT
ncbi:MAG: HAMP domain-containing histidine kinase [Rhodospirillales bacterium]|nr:HAMP domain-containing histidine kinase [Rhodospirillales bacterium]